MRWLTVAGVLALAGLVAWLVVQRGPGAARFAVRGIDVSHHQGAIDWQQVAGAGVAFAFIKATEGADHHDTRFPENWAAAGEAGLVRGAYHFFTFCSPGAEQAAHFLAVVPPDPAALPPAIDVEFAGNCRSWTSLADIRRELRVMLERVEAAWGRAPVLYLTRESQLRVTRDQFPGHPVWIRNTLWEPAGADREAWLFWQHSDRGEIPGVDTPVDLNVFRGTREDFASLAGGG